MEGWIKVHRKFLQWEWYDDTNTVRLFFHILLMANHKDKKYRGKTVKRGSLLTGRELLASQLNLSTQNIRTSLSKLKSTNEVTIKTSSQGTEIQINNYDKYQDTTNEITNNQPTTNQRLTTNKNERKKEDINIDDFFENFRKLYPGTKRGLKTEIENFKKKHKDWEQILPQLEQAILTQIEDRKQKHAAGVFVPEWKHLQTWINQRCWETETQTHTNDLINNISSPEIDNYDLSPEHAKTYNDYFDWVKKNFPSLLKSNCRVYSKDDFFDLLTDRTVTMRKYRITESEYKELKEQAHKDLNEKAYLRQEFKTVYDYTRHLMRKELEHA